LVELLDTKNLGAKLVQNIVARTFSPKNNQNTTFPTISNFYPIFKYPKENLGFYMAKSITFAENLKDSFFTEQ
jgi:hypothetical protein